MVSVPGPVLVTAPLRLSGALISWLPLVTVMVPPLTVSVPPPGAMVYLLALSKLMSFTVWLLSSVTVRGAVILPRKLAIAVGLLGTPPSQFVATLQLPLASTFHCGLPPSRRRTMSWLAVSLTNDAVIPEKPFGFAR